MSDFRLLMRQKKIAEEAGIFQQMVSSVTAKVGITSLNSHFCSGDHGTICWYGAKEARVWIKVCKFSGEELEFISCSSHPISGSFLSFTCRLIIPPFYFGTILLLPKKTSNPVCLILTQSYSFATDFAWQCACVSRFLSFPKATHPFPL